MRAPLPLHMNAAEPMEELRRIGGLFGGPCTAAEGKKLLKRLRVLRAKRDTAFALARLGKSTQRLDDEFFRPLEAFGGPDRVDFNDAVKELVDEQRAVIVRSRGGLALAASEKHRPRIIEDDRDGYSHWAHMRFDGGPEYEIDDGPGYEPHVDKVMLLGDVYDLGRLPLTRETFRLWDIWFHGSAEQNRELIADLVSEGNLEIRHEPGGAPYAQLPERIAKLWKGCIHGERTASLPYPKMVISEKNGVTVVTYGWPPPDRRAA